jgi:hypothetical protein
MAQLSDDDNNVCKRKRLTGSSKWTMNAISRQIAERQANLDIKNMVVTVIHYHPVREVQNYQ